MKRINLIYLTCLFRHSQTVSSLFFIFFNLKNYSTSLFSGMLEKAFPSSPLNFTACSRSFSSPTRYSCSYTIKFPRVSAKFSRISHFYPIQLILYAPGKPTIQPEVFSTCFLLEVRESTFQIAIYSFKRSIPPVSPSNFSFYLLIENISSLVLPENIFVHKKKTFLIRTNIFI